MDIESRKEGYIIQADGVRQYVTRGPMFEAINRGDYGDIPEAVPSFSDREAWREVASCTLIQGAIAMGEAEWTRALAMQEDFDVPFEMRISITGYSEWNRNSEAIDQLSYLMGYDAEQTDRLFVRAMNVTV